MTWRFMLGMLVVVAIPDTIGAQGNTAPVKVGGVIYAHYRYLLSDEAGSGNNFDVARAYINVTGTLGHGVAFRITPDIHRTDDESLTYRLKYAYAAYTPS